MIEEISFHILLCFVSAFFLFIWFETEAVLEYAKLFRLDSLFFTKEYEEAKKTIEDLTYPSYLEIYQKNFINKILSCVYCLCTWVIIYLNFMLSFEFGLSTFKFFGLDWFFTLCIYFSFNNQHNR
tara:strand:+ start:537 stop:911 length:375 start_codon:yes stop_codon:yes gene_type:complete